MFRILLKIIENLEDNHCLDVISECYNIAISQRKDQMNKPNGKSSTTLQQYHD